MQAGKAPSVGALIDAAVRGELSTAQALRLWKDNPEVTILELLVAGQRIAEQDDRIAEQDDRVVGQFQSSRAKISSIDQR